MNDAERSQLVVNEFVERKLFLRPQNPSHISPPQPAGELAREPQDEPARR